MPVSCFLIHHGADWMLWDAGLGDEIAAVQRSKVEPVAADRDVFGDGTVRMASTPGHMIDHHSLMVHLPRTGWVILTGDVAHFAENYARNLVPPGNANRADTIASIERIKGLAAHYHARVAVQHGADVFETMPRFPAYLD